MVVQLTRLLSLTGHLNYRTDEIKSSKKRLLLLYEICQWEKLVYGGALVLPMIIFAPIIFFILLFFFLMFLFFSIDRTFDFIGFSIRYNVLPYTRGTKR